MLALNTASETDVMPRATCFPNQACTVLKILCMIVVSMTFDASGLRKCDSYRFIEHVTE